MADRQPSARERLVRGTVRRPVLLAVLSIVLAVPALASEIAGGFRGGAAQPVQKTQGPQTPPGTDTIRRWNEIAIDASGLDHAPVPPGDPRIPGEQLGPTRSSRAVAIVHIAMFA